MNDPDFQINKYSEDYMLRHPHLKKQLQKEKLEQEKQLEKELRVKKKKTIRKEFWFLIIIIKCWTIHDELIPVISPWW